MQIESNISRLPIFDASRQTIGKPSNRNEIEVISLILRFFASILTIAITLISKNREEDYDIDAIASNDLAPYKYSTFLIDLRSLFFNGVYFIDCNNMRAGTSLSETRSFLYAV